MSGVVSEPLGVVLMRRKLRSGGCPEPPFDVQSGILPQQDACGGQLRANNRSGLVVESEPDDVEQVGCLFDTGPVRKRLQLCRNEWSWLGERTVCSLVVPPPTARICSGVAERRAQS